VEEAAAGVWAMGVGAVVRGRGCGAGLGVAAAGAAFGSSGIGWSGRGSAEEPGLPLSERRFIRGLSMAGSTKLSSPGEAGVLDEVEERGRSGMLLDK
jgi:hypothetical protein